MKMFGHLQAEDFTNLLEGVPLADPRQAHLRSCTRCRETFASVQEVQTQIKEMRIDEGDYIPEPDWSDFRADVRNALLSRSVKRENTGRRWLGGMTLKPAVAWGISMLLVFGLMLSVMWNQRHAIPESTQAQAIDDSSPEADLSSLSAMSQADQNVFDDLVYLNADEAQSLQMILDNMAHEGVSRQ